jgi:hypothetical protein
VRCRSDRQRQVLLAETFAADFALWTEMMALLHPAEQTVTRRWPPGSEPATQQEQYWAALQMLEELWSVELS